MDMKTYLTIWFNSEGVEPLRVVQRLQGMGFKPITGKHDHVYDWRREVSLEEVLRLGNAVHETLKGCKVLYKMETA
jgi:hypothetical protein